MTTNVTQPPEQKIIYGGQLQTSTNVEHNLAIPHAALAEFCQQHHIRKLSLFGSVLRDDFGPESDVDVIAEFESDAHIHYIKFVQVQEELSQLFDREVDLHTPNSLSRHFRAKVLQAAKVLYERPR
jgi:predicted nucleotidyltransferase